MRRGRYTSPRHWFVWLTGWFFLLGAAWLGVTGMVVGPTTEFPGSPTGWATGLLAVSLLNFAGYFDKIPSRWVVALTIAMVTTRMVGLVWVLFLEWPRGLGERGLSVIGWFAFCMLAWRAQADGKIARSESEL